MIQYKRIGLDTSQADVTLRGVNQQEHTPRRSCEATGDAVRPVE
jgi:hypothetical protein